MRRGRLGAVVTSAGVLSALVLAVAAPAEGHSTARGGVLTEPCPAAPTTPPPASTPPCRDTTPPRVRLTGISGRCTGADLRARVRVRDSSPLRAVAIYLNGRRSSRTKDDRFGFRIPFARLRPGANRLAVVAVDRPGNRFTLTQRFKRCA